MHPWQWLVKGTKAAERKGKTGEKAGNREETLGTGLLGMQRCSKRLAKGWEERVEDNT